MSERQLLTEIGPYRIEGRLGAGGMGEVYRAYDARLDRSVAIKLIRPESSADQTARERFRREARAAAALTHPSIVRIYDVVASGEGEAIVMELVEGELLSQRIARGPLPVDEAVRLGRQIAEGLAAAHRRGILHRDLKAENVIITPDGEAKIMDFGLAKRLDGEPEGSLTRSDAVIGTFRAMSPEQARGMALDQRSDLFSFGVLLYEMLTGVSPFRTGSAPDTLMRICTTRQAPVRELRPEVPEGLSSLIDHLLEKAPALRPGGAREVARELDRKAAAAFPQTALATEIEIPVTTVGGAPQTRRWSYIAFPVALFLVSAGLVAWLWGRHPKEPLHVAVLKTEVQGPDAEAVTLVGFGVRVALFRALLSFDGITPLAPEEVDPYPGPPKQLARATAAHEVVASSLHCDAKACQVTLSRILGKDGTLIWSQTFAVPIGEPFLLAEAVEGQLAAGYSSFQVRNDRPALAISAADYTEYLRLRLSFETRKEEEFRIDQMLERLESIRFRSPGFVDAAILQSALYRYRFRDRRDPQDLEKAFAILLSAHDQAPTDPRPLLKVIDLALLAEKLDRAETALRQLESSQPGDPAVAIRRAKVLERRGAREQALSVMRDAISRQESWSNLLQLADMEFRLGEAAAARTHLQELLRRAPGHYEGTSLLAQVELLSGSPQRAATLYADLVRRSPQFAEVVNLGVSSMLLGQYAEAEKRFRQGLATEPANPLVVLVLADVLLLQEKKQEAGVLYRQLLTMIDRDPAASHWQLISARAQALAHLGERRQAVESIQQVLVAARTNTEAAYEAAVVYCLVGDQSSALVQAERALARGISPSWFRFPWFDSLRAIPEFGKSLATALPS